MLKNIIFISVFFCWALVSMLLNAQVITPLQHAMNFTDERADSIEIGKYWISEKLDGVRGYWNGEQLLTRQGNPIFAPDWFTKPLGNIALDGELWMGRASFEQISALVRSHNPLHNDWKRVKFMIFDLPHDKDKFDFRVKKMKQYIEGINLPWIQMVEQKKFTSMNEVNQYHQRIIAMGGEGLMLHHQESFYQSARVQHLIKLKQVYDREGTVLAYIEGKGKYTGMMGSLLIAMENGIHFRLGSGFSDAERKNPPPIGAIVTFQYNGYSKKGVPRFARFLRVRDDAAKQENK